jgi:phage-related protein
MPMKSIVWLGDSRKRIGEFPDKARSRAGFELWAVQQGVEPSDWKPMPSIGAGVREIRVHAGGEFRVIYVARFDEAVYVLHAFEKKTPRTSRTDIALGGNRYRALLNERNRR